MDWTIWLTSKRPTDLRTCLWLATSARGALMSEVEMQDVRRGDVPAPTSPYARGIEYPAKGTIFAPFWTWKS